MDLEGRDTYNGAIYSEGFGFTGGLGAAGRLLDGLATGATFIVAQMSTWRLSPSLPATAGGKLQASKCLTNSPSTSHRKTRAYCNRGQEHD